MDLFETFENRHSIRSYRPDPVPADLVAKVLAAASLAPSALNEQPWQFYVVSGETRRRVGELMSQSTHYLEDFLTVLGHQATPEHLKWYSELGGAPVIIVCTMPRVDDEFLLMNKYLSVGGAVENLLLAATGLGLGTCAVTFSFWVRDEIGRLLGVPEDRMIVSMVTLGYPTDQPPIAPPHRADVAVYLD